MNRIVTNVYVLILLLVSFGILVHTAVSQERKPIFGIFLDNTGSLHKHLKLEVEIAKAVLKRIEPQSSVSVFAFAPDTNSRSAQIAVGLECSVDRLLIDKQLDRIVTVAGQTALFDSVKVAAERLGNSKPSHCGEFSERSLVIISDGEDRSSLMTAEGLISFLKASGIKPYIVGLVEGLNGGAGFIRKSERDRSTEFLEKLAKETGGSVVIVSKKRNAEDIVKELFEPQPSPKK